MGLGSEINDISSKKLRFHQSEPSPSIGAKHRKCWRATAWRRPAAPATDMPPVPQMRNRANTIRSLRYPSQPRPGTSSVCASPISPAAPFLPNSLLATNGNTPVSQGQIPMGHGVATGDRNATRPMLDMSPQSPFAEGSLLRQL